NCFALLLKSFFCLTVSYCILKPIFACECAINARLSHTPTISFLQFMLNTKTALQESFSLQGCFDFYLAVEVLIGSWSLIKAESGDSVSFWLTPDFQKTPNIPSVRSKPTI